MISLLADDPMISLLSDDDLHLFNEGSQLRLYEHLGAHLKPGGTQFAVWAPNAMMVNVVGDWNGWNKHQDALAPRGKSGIWEGFVKGIGKGTKYKFHIEGQGGYRVDKADPLAVHAETPPRTASVVWDLDYKWGDAKWMEERGPRSALDAPLSIYEMHIGSWRRLPEEGNRPLNYRELAEPLCDYLKRLGFTHVEFLPVMEHPFYGSWGYQTTGYFAPTSRYGTPQDFMYLIDRLHTEAFGRQPGVQTYAEESTSWPGVSRPIWLGGLGFGFKWDMGWMHDTLDYLERDPVHRRFHHHALTFRGLYAFHENFVLPLSHDEVVHGKGSLIGKMAGDDWQKRANLRLLYANQWSLPGKKLLFMGGELGQWREWSHESSLEWHLLADEGHAGIQR